MLRLLKLSTGLLLLALSVLIGLAFAGLVDASGEHELRSVPVSDWVGVGEGFTGQVGSLFAPLFDLIVSFIGTADEAPLESNAQLATIACLGLLLFLPWLRADLFTYNWKAPVITGLFMGLFTLAAVLIAAALPWPGDVFTRSVIVAVFAGLPLLGLALATVVITVSEGEPVADAFSQSWLRWLSAVVFVPLAIGISALVELGTRTSLFAFVVSMSAMLMLIGGTEVHTSQYRRHITGVLRSAGLAVIGVPFVAFAMYAVDWMMVIDMLPGDTIQ